MKNGLVCVVMALLTIFVAFSQNRFRFCSKLMTHMNERKTEVSRNNAYRGTHFTWAKELLLPFGGNINGYPTWGTPWHLTTSVSSFSSLLNSLISLGYEHNRISFPLTNAPLSRAEPPSS